LREKVRGRNGNRERTDVKDMEVNAIKRCLRRDC